MCQSRAVLAHLTQQQNALTRGQGSTMTLPMPASALPVLSLDQKAWACMYTAFAAAG